VAVATTNGSAGSTHIRLLLVAAGINGDSSAPAKNVQHENSKRGDASSESKMTTAGFSDNPPNGLFAAASCEEAFGFFDIEPPKKFSIQSHYKQLCRENTYRYFRDIVSMSESVARISVPLYSPVQEFIW
jgi:hypothetical protein